MAQGHAAGPPAGVQAPAAPRVPGCPHAYPLAVREAGFSVAFKLAWQTKGYALFRYLHLCLYALICGVFIAVLLGLTVPLTLYVHQYAGGIVAMGGFAAGAFFGWPVVRRKLLGTLCGHIAILTDLVTQGRIGNGEESAFAYARRLVETRLGELEQIWKVRCEINSGVCQFHRVLDRVDDWLPIDLSFIESLTRRLVAWASPYVEAVIISYGLARGDRDFASAGLDGLCYSAQNGKEVFKTAVRVAIWDKLMMLPVWIVSLAAFVTSAFYVTYAAMGADVADLMADPGDEVLANGLAFTVAFFVAAFVGGGLSLFAVATLRATLVQPILITMVLVRFHAMIENQPLDPTWKERITRAGIALDNLDKLTLRMSRFAPD